MPQPFDQDDPKAVAAQEASEENAPALLKGLPRSSGMQLDPSRGIRTMKLVSPSCDVCAPEQWEAPHNWWRDCPHDPYTHLEPRQETIVEYQDGSNGERVVKSRVVQEVERPWPNLRQIPATRRHQGNSNNGSSSFARSKFTQFGWIPPEDVRSPAFPNGIAQMCQYRDCYNQEVRHYASGWFCQEMEAVICWEDDNYVKTEVNLEVGNEDHGRQQQYAKSRNALLGSQ